MTFNSSNFNRNSTAPDGTSKSSVNLFYLYSTSDTLNDIDTAASSYFNSVADKLVQGDQIGITASDGKAVYFVLSSNRDTSVNVVRYF